MKIPGRPIAYWISEGMLKTFESGTPLGNFADVSADRKIEFRDLILNLKPVQNIGVLLINYI